jgi:hypothetical protein
VQPSRDNPNHLRHVDALRKAENWGCTRNKLPHHETVQESLKIVRAVHCISHSINREILAVLQFDFRLTHGQQFVAIHTSPTLGVVYLGGVSGGKTQKKAGGEKH